MKISIALYFILLSSFGTALSAQNELLKTVIALKPGMVYFSSGDSIKLDQADEVQNLFFIFHVEEDSIGLDPGLSVEGRWRAIHFAKLISPFKLKNCYTTPFRRDVLSLQPLTDGLKIQPKYYDQSGLNVFYESLNNDFPGTCVIVAHKQTISRIFESLTKLPFTETLDKEAPNRLFLIQKKKNQAGKLYSWLYRVR